MSTTGELKAGLTYNKQLWAITCGTLLSTSVEAARKQLHKARSQILSGICFYRNFNQDSEKKLQSGLDAKTHTFVVNIAKQMNLDALQAWDLMVFYLEHEFRGSEDNLESFLENDARKEQLVKDICSFYWSERSFLLKCIGIYLAYWQDDDHPFAEAFAELLSDLKPAAVLESLLKQLKYLTEHSDPPTSNVSLSRSSSKPTSNISTEQWLSVYLREHLSVIHNLILFVDGNSYAWSDVLETLKLFKCVLPYRHRLKRQHLPLLHAITCSQVVLLLRMIDVSNLGFSKRLWTEEGRKLFSNMDSELQALNSKEEHGPLLLVWMLFNFLGPEGDDTFSKYRKFAIMASKLGVFSFLDRLLNEHMFKSETTKVADIAYSTVYKFLDTLAVNFEPDQLQPREKLLALFATLLRQPATADHFWKAEVDSGLRLIFDMSQRQFPVEFESFVNIVTCLAAASPESCRQVIGVVAEMNTLVESIRPALLPLLTRLIETNNGVRLNTTHCPLPHVNSVILRPGTLGTLEDGLSQSVSWKFKYSFWLAIHSAESSLLNQISLSTGGGVEHNVVARTLCSVRCIAACLESGCEIEPAMVLPIEMVFTLMERFLLMSNPKSAMMAACLDVASCLITAFPLDVTNKLRALDFLPTTQPDEEAVMTHASFAKGHFFNAGVLGRIVVNEERPAGSFPLIRSYLSFLQNLIATGCKEKEQQSVAISGLVYVILEVFPRCFEWGYAALRERTQLCNLCLKLFHRLLHPAALRSDDATDLSFERLLAHTCLYSMLYTDNGHTMLRICSFGEAELKAQMLQQTSWLSGDGVDLVSLVHLALSILNRVLLLKNSVKTSNDLSPTEKLIYASPNAKNSLQVVPNIAYYVYHCFNPRMPILAVKLLKRIALEVPMTLRACLAMDGDVIREAFVAKLDSAHQSVQLKVAILELITACIHTQPGATEAFFNIHHPEESRRLFSKDKSPNEDPSGCLTYACNLLSRAKDEPAIVRSMLYGAVVELLHALWMHHQKILLSFLRSKKTFWVDLCASLFLPPSHSVRGYAQVLNILSSEIYTFGSNVHEQLMEQLKKLFTERNYLETWSKFITSSLCVDCGKTSVENSDILASIEESSEIPNEDVIRERLALMTAWKDLLLVVLGELRSSPELSISERQQSALAGHVMKALNQEALRDSSASSRCVARPAAITMLAELLLVLQARWKSLCFDNPDAAVSQLRCTLMRFSFIYHDLPPRTRTALLSCAIYSTQLLKSTIQKDEVATELLVKATITMLSYEIQALSGRKDSQSHETPCKLSVTLLQVLCEAIAMASHGPWQALLSQSKIVALVTVSLSEALVTQSNLHFARSALYLLLSLAGSENNSSLLNLPLIQDQLWIQLTPKGRTPPTNQPFQTPESWVNSEWSSVFCVGLELVSTLLERHGVRALEIAVNFCAVQESALLDCLLLARHSFEAGALTLTEATLKLLVQLVPHASQWRLLAFRTFCNLVRGVTMCLDICVGLLNRPHLLSSLSEGIKLRISSSLHSENIDFPIKVTPKLSTCSNKLMNAVVLSIAFLRHLSPGVTPLLCDRELDVEAWSPLLEPSWSAPAHPGHRQNMHCLTFGTLLASINLFSFTAATLKHGSSANRHAKSPLTRGSRGLRVTASPGRLGAGTSPDPDECDAAAWVQRLDFDRAQLGLQMSLTLLASQGLLLLRAKEYRDQSLLRREVSSEMTQFVELMRRTFGEHLDSDKDPLPVPGLSAIEEGHENRVPGRSPVVRRLQLRSKADAPSTDETFHNVASIKASIFSCSESDYLRLMAHIFQRVFRE